MGLVLGFLGILGVGVWEGLGSGEWTGIAACVGALCSNSASIPYIRRHLTGLPEGGVGLATGEVVCGAAVLLPLTVASAPPPGPLALNPVLAILVSGALGAGIAYALNYQIVAEAGPSTATMVMYVMPLFAIVAGVAFLANMSPGTSRSAAW
jgi:drug/metabolite transporter (DMT)-like permease